jgi:hypothetical protein
MKQLALLALLIPTNAAAGAWLQPEGTGHQVIANFTYYEASQGFDAKGNKYVMPKYSKYEFNPYAEYGLYDDITIGGSFAAQREINESSGDDSYSVGDVHLFARTYLYTGSIYHPADFVVSVEPGIYLPISSSSDLNEQTGISPSVKLNLGYSDVDYYADASVGYAYWSNTSDRIKAEASLGYYIADDWVFLNQAFAELVTDKDYTNSGNYDLVKAQSSVVWQYDEVISHQLGVSYDIYGRNTGAGMGFLYSLWYRF